MKNLAEVLLQLAPAIDQIASVSGVPGMSIGVFHEGDVVFHYNYGHRDLSAKLPTTTSTIYPIGSLSKAFTAFACGALVDDGVLEWDTPIRSILPEFQSTSPEVQALASPRDLLSHRTGIPGGESLYFHAQPLLNDSAIVPTFGALPPVLPFRDQMFYNNLGYGLLALAMTSRSGLSYEDLIRSKISGPLKLQQTGLNFTDPRQTAMLAKTYIVTETTEPVENKRPQFAPGSSMAAAGGIRSSVDDLLIFYREVLKQLSPHAGLKSTPAPSPSLKEIKAIMSAQTFIKNTEKTIMERTYGLGWIRTQLPGQVGVIGLNSWLVEMPTVNSSRLTIYHQGNLPGATSAVYLFPETQSGVVVLANAYGLSDAPDWVAQLLIDALFENESKTDHVKLAEDTVSGTQSYRLGTVEDLEAIKKDEATRPKSLEPFVGRYTNTAGTFFIEIVSANGALKLMFQGMGEETFPLKHLHDDVFSWFTSTRELAEQGRHIFPVPHYLIRFHRGLGGQVVHIEWAHNGGDDGGEFFTKQTLGAATNLWMIYSGTGAAIVVVAYFAFVKQKKEKST